MNGKTLIIMDKEIKQSFNKAIRLLEPDFIEWINKYEAVSVPSILVQGWIDEAPPEWDDDTLYRYIIHQAYATFMKGGDA